MRVAEAALGMLCCLVLIPCAQAQEPEPPPMPQFSVGEIDFSSLRWGRQTAAFEVTNNTGELKYVTVETKVEFTGSYLDPNRRTLSHYVLVPLEARIFRPTVYVPGNFGQAKVIVSLYDVVDTLDIVLPGQKFFEQPFSITFHVPDDMLAYVNERIDLPPMVGRHPDFDNEFSRTLLELINEGRSVGEIAALAMADTAFVQDAVNSLVAKGHVTKKGESFELAFPFISVAEAEEAKGLAAAVSDTLAEIIERSMATYGAVLDSLIAVGAVDKDSNAFLDGGGVLYRPYPVISALLLWFHLGQRFITRSTPLEIYDGTDLCNAHIPSYMYAVKGGAIFNGTQFYAFTPGGSTFQLFFGDKIPVPDCGSDFILKAKLRQPITWSLTGEFLPETFILDTAAVNPMLSTLGAGADEVLERTYDALSDIAKKHGHTKLTYGQSFWFWNLAATGTLKKLVQRGVVTRRGNGQFRFDGIPPDEG